MSHGIDEYYDVYRETRRCARKAHVCDACKEPIAPGHVYFDVCIIWQREAEPVKRCARCQAIHKHLRENGDCDMWPDERLDCGMDYLDHWGEDPPPEIAALAFALPGETI